MCKYEYFHSLKMFWCNIRSSFLYCLLHITHVKTIEYGCEEHQCHTQQTCSSYLLSDILQLTLRKESFTHPQQSINLSSHMHQQQHSYSFRTSQSTQPSSFFFSVNKVPLFLRLANTENIYNITLTSTVAKRF